MSEQLSEETQIELEKAIEPKLKADIELIQEKLKKLSDGKEYKTFDTIEPELLNT